MEGQLNALQTRLNAAEGARQKDSKALTSQFTSVKQRVAALEGRGVAPPPPIEGLDDVPAIRDALTDVVGEMDILSRRLDLTA